jgi:hypothetical protein
MHLIRHPRSTLIVLSIAVLPVFPTAARAGQTPAIAGAVQAAIGPSGESAAAVPGLPTTTSSQVTGAVPVSPPAIAGTSVLSDPTAGTAGQSAQTAGSPEATGNADGTVAGNTGTTPAGNTGTTPAGNMSTTSQPPQMPTGQPAPGGGDQGAQPSSPQTPETTTAGSSASSGQPAPQTAGAQSTGSTATQPAMPNLTLPAESNATSQSIWQVQVSGCTANCVGINQTQLAAQQNATVQVLDGAGQLTPTSGPASSAGASGSTSSITQIQAGCIWQCLGTTTTGGAIPQVVQQAVAQVLSVVLATAGLPPQQSVPATAQNVVDQTSYQWQLSQGPSATQAQSASQIDSTVQNATSSVSATLHAALGAPSSSAGEVVNQTDQGIWQVQIGCLIFCAQTEQYQQADQSNTTIQVLQSALGVATQTATAAINSTTQIIWQLQIGCLMWCLDTAEQQFASSTETTLVAIISPTPTGANSPPGPTSSGGASSDTASPGTPPPGTASSDPASGAGGTAPRPAPPPAGPPPVTSEPAPSHGTPTRPSSTMTLSSIPFTTGVAQRGTGSATPLVTSLTPSGTAVGTGSETPVIIRLPAPRPLVAHLGSDVIAASATLGPTTRIAGSAVRRGLSHRGGHGPARILPMPVRSPLAGSPEPAKAAARKAGGMSSAALAAALAAAIALVALSQLRRRSTT